MYSGAEFAWLIEDNFRNKCHQQLQSTFVISNNAPNGELDFCFTCQIYVKLARPILHIGLKHNCHCQCHCSIHILQVMTILWMMGFGKSLRGLPSFVIKSALRNGGKGKKNQIYILANWRHDGAIYLLKLFLMRQ